MVTERTVSEGGLLGGAGNIGFASAIISALATAEVPLVWHPGTTPFVFKCALIMAAPEGTQEWATAFQAAAFWTQPGFPFIDPPGSDGDGWFIGLEGDTNASRARSSARVGALSVLFQRTLAGPTTENFFAEARRIDTPSPELRLVEFSGGALTNTFSVDIRVGAMLFG